jgi:shikimate dehydrogenase
MQITKKIESNFQMSSTTSPTFYFIGVSTSSSSIMKVFPLWMKALGQPEIVLAGIDHRIHDTREAYRATVTFIKEDPLSLGGLVTTHKIDLFEAARDLFDHLQPAARITGEVSSISKRGVELWGQAVDPVTAGLSLDAILENGYFGRTGAQVLCFGAGGSGKAIALHFISQPDPMDRPGRIRVVNRSQGRLDSLREMVDSLKTRIEFEYIQNSDPELNDRLLAGMPPGSLVINATGMGKDSPGSPITNKGIFPQSAIAWEINYRGELDFWHQAMAQKDHRHLVIEDGWLYFLHGWTQVISDVLHIEITNELFQQLSAIAAELRPALVYRPPDH